MRLSKPRKHPVINERLCKKCDICVTFCPKKVLDPRTGAMPAVARPEDCNACELCILRCPDFAIDLEEAKEK